MTISLLLYIQVVCPLVSIPLKMRKSLTFTSFHLNPRKKLFKFFFNCTHYISPRNVFSQILLRLCSFFFQFLLLDLCSCSFISHYLLWTSKSNDVFFENPHKISCNINLIFFCVCSILRMLCSNWCCVILLCSWYSLVFYVCNTSYFPLCFGGAFYISCSFFPKIVGNSFLYHLHI